MPPIGPFSRPKLLGGFARILVFMLCVGCWTPLKTTQGEFTLRGSGIANGPIGGSVDAGRTGGEVGTRFNMIMLFERMPDSSTDYLGGMVDIWSAHKLVSGTYRVLSRTAWNLDQVGTVSLELRPNNGCGSLWTPETGTMTVSVGSDSVRGEVRAQLRGKATSCNRPSPVQSDLVLTFSYARHWWN